MCQSVPSVHTERDQFCVERLPVRSGGRSRTRYPSCEQDDPWTEHTGVPGRQSRHRRGKSYGGNGGHSALARHMAKRDSVLRRCTLRDPVPHSRG